MKQIVHEGTGTVETVFPWYVPKCLRRWIRMRQTMKMARKLGLKALKEKDRITISVPDGWEKKSPIVKSVATKLGLKVIELKISRISTF